MSTPYTEPVLAWYARHQRDLPWRAPGTTPWSVLVSEIMLQQTPVARVLPGARGVARPVAHAGRAGGRAGRRGDQAVGQARLPAAGAAAARDGRHPDRAARRAGAGRPRCPARRCRGSAATPPRPWPASPSASGTRCSTPTSAGCWPGSSTGQPRPAAAPSVAETRLAESLLPAEPAVAARWSVAVMELGALVCTAASPRCAACPVARRLRLAGRGPAAAAGAGPAPGAALRRHRPAVPRAAARGAARFRRRR